jgi:hypothetical protein
MTGHLRRMTNGIRNRAKSIGHPYMSFHGPFSHPLP